MTAERQPAAVEPRPTERLRRRQPEVVGVALLGDGAWLVGADVARGVVTGGPERGGASVVCGAAVLCGDAVVPVVGFAVVGVAPPPPPPPPPPGSVVAVV